MKNEQLFDAMFHRKSIRKYDMTQLSQSDLTEIKDFAASIEPLDKSIKYELVYLTGDDVNNIMPIKAPYYICMYSEKKDNYLMNTGYILQQIDLFISAKNLGSCWLGMARPSKHVEQLKSNLEFVVMLAFGNTKDEVHRADTSLFKRNSIKEICDIYGAEELLEPVRLAPSASNTQPWFFSGTIDEIIVSRQKLNIIKAPMYGKMNQIDIGISLFHLKLSLNHQNRNATFDFSKSIAPSGYEFMVKVKSTKNL